jgi:hypothetical protein
MTSDTRHRLTRQQLYALVWSEPVSKIAPRYNISGVGFTKLCRREDVPLPPRGYWAKLKFGKKVPKPRLKPRENPKDETIVIADRPQIERPDLPADIATAIEYENLDEARIVVPNAVSKWHPIVEKWFEDDRRPATFWSGSPNRAAKITPLERRRRTLLTVLYRALERRGWTVTAESHAKFTIGMLGQTMTFGVGEVSNKSGFPSPQRIVESRTILLMKPIVWSMSRRACYAYGCTSITGVRVTGPRQRIGHSSRA